MHDMLGWRCGMIMNDKRQDRGMLMWHALWNGSSIDNNIFPSPMLQAIKVTCHSEFFSFARNPGESLKAIIQLENLVDYRAL
jgi:hypothetical protein